MNNFIQKYLRGLSVFELYKAVFECKNIINVLNEKERVVVTMFNWSCLCCNRFFVIILLKSTTESQARDIKSDFLCDDQRNCDDTE